MLQSGLGAGEVGDHFAGEDFHLFHAVEDGAQDYQARASGDDFL